MKLKDRKDIVMPKKKEVGDDIEYSVRFIKGFNKAIDICGEINIPSIDEGKIIEALRKEGNKSLSITRINKYQFKIVFYRYST